MESPFDDICPICGKGKCVAVARNITSTRIGSCGHRWVPADRDPVALDFRMGRALGWTVKEYDTQPRTVTLCDHNGGFVKTVHLAKDEHHNLWAYLPEFCKGRYGGLLDAIMSKLDKIGGRIEINDAFVVMHYYSEDCEEHIVTVPRQQGEPISFPLCRAFCEVMGE